MNASAPGTGPRQLNAPKDMAPDSTPAGMMAKAAKTKIGPAPVPGQQAPTPASPTSTGYQAGQNLYAAGQKAAGRIGEFATGASTARGSTPSVLSPSGAAGTLDEDV